MTPQDRPWLSLYSPGVTAEYRPEHRSLLVAFEGRVAENPDATQLFYFDRTLSRADVDADAAAIAAAMREAGVAAGDRVALYLQNVPQFVIGLLAVWKLGAIAVSVSPMYKAREARQILKDSGAKAVIVLEDLWNQYGEEASEGLDIVVVLTTSPREYQCRNDPRAFEASDTSDVHETVWSSALRRFRHETTLPQLSPEPNLPALLVYTSGTTGTPKGAILTHGNVWAGSQTYRDWFEIRGDDVVLGIAPLFHVTGLTGAIGLSIASGAPLVLFHRFQLDLAIDVIAERRPTFTVGASTVFVAIMNSPSADRDALSSFRVLGTGGAPVAAATLRQFEKRFGLYIHNVYGMTETTSPTHSTPLGMRAPVDPRSGAVSVGVPVPSSGAWILDESGHELPVGEIGELAVSGPRITPGYWNRPEATAAAFADGRFKTGDLAFMDQDGWFYLVDRKKDMIIASGFKVYPREVEDVLYEHPAVLEAAVIGIPDNYRGESVKAFVSLRTGQTATPEELIRYCRERMAAYKYPRSIEILFEIPKNATGKILRRELR
jgi:long-chain acyl-CoA synthetase